LVCALVVLCLVVPNAAGAELGTVSGTVREASGAAVVRAQVALLDAQLVAVRTAETDEEGRFTLDDVPVGRYVLSVMAGERGLHQQLLAVGEAATIGVEITLSPDSFQDRVVVTATPGIVQDQDSLSQAVNLIDAEEIALRAKTATAQIGAEEPGLFVQQTSPTIGGIFVRGFTGNKVNVFVDGVRFSTAAMRGGINSFMNLLDPTYMSGVEVLRGPSSSQYGSDAIGGSLQFLTRSPELSDEPRVGGEVGVQAGTAAESGGLSLTGSYADKTFGVVATVAGRTVNDLRPGEGIDSHNAVTRYLGLPSSVVIDGELPDTSYQQYGGALKFEWQPSPNGRMVGAYLRSNQDDGQRYDQLLGGDGNLVADLRDFVADFAYLKYEHSLSGWFDAYSVGYSYNAQEEERVNQGGSGNPAASINHEPEETTAHGLQASFAKFADRHTFSFGVDATEEEVRGNSFGVNPTTGAVTLRRGRVPNGASYRQGGIYVQDTYAVMPSKLTLNGSLRWAGARYRARASDSPLVNGLPLWPNDELDVSAVTFRTGAVYTLADGMFASANISTGFRAPHITDLGTLGLTGSGFEVAAPDVTGLGAEVGSTADANAVSTGDPVLQVDSETSITYEAAFRLDRDKYKTTVTAFLNNVDDNITKQTLILPQGAVGLTLGGETITSQSASGAVFVAASPNPVLVRANFDDAQVYGLELDFATHLTPRLRFSTVGTYLHAEDRKTGLPPNIEGGTPPPEAYFFLRWWTASRKLWVEPYLRLVADQDRLSSLDLADRRTGAGRSASSIAGFFNNGARARGLIGDGADGTAGTADDVLLATGETLAEVQLRVLGPSLAASPLYSEVPGYTTFGVRSGLSFGKSELLFDFENLTDENYRGPSWGVDAPGRGFYVSYRIRG
jgi:outer membrane receptor protein involved in Fe transport